MKPYIPLLFILSLVKLTVQWLGNRNYGFHRDELLHLSVSEHLDWGFMEFPPFIGVIGKVAYGLFDYSLWGVRLFPTLAGVAILVLCGFMARALGGKFKAILLAALCVLAFLPFYRNHTLFQPVAFDQLFWTMGFYWVIRFINAPNKKYLVLIGITLGIGLLNKYTMLVWGFGLCMGLLFYKKGSLFRNPWLYGSALIAFLIFLPNIIWQVQNDYPLLQHLQALDVHQLDAIDPMAFGRAQLDFPFTLIISLFGIMAFFIDARLKKYRAVGISAIIIFGTMWMMNAKAYYVFALYPVLFAAGAVKLEALLSKKSGWMYVIGITVVVPSIYFIPRATPLLPIEQYVVLYNLEEQNGRVELTSDYADMFGWEAQVKAVDSLYRTLTPQERANCVLWAENYGEAGALTVLGKNYDLPHPISRHGSFWTWGYGDKDAEVWISIGNEMSAVEEVFAEVTLVKIITHRYAIAEENGIPLLLCRKPKVEIDTWWRAYRPYIFD